MSEIVIGKHTLESLTTGMYSDPFVVYREYIQNAADSIDEAVNSKLIDKNAGEIYIEISSAEHRICIKDNGAGICAEAAEKTLISIGNSKKTTEMSRGFRGIGRLSALSYCAKITFETTCAGENVGTKIVFDAHQLSCLLLSNDSVDLTVTDVLQKVYTVSRFPARKSSHFFNVTMEEVDQSSGLTNYDVVLSYVSQNAPVPYNPNEFAWGKEIVNRLKQEGIALDTYKITVSNGRVALPVYKPYKDEFIVDKSKNISDRVNKIEIIRIVDSKKNITAIGWIGRTEYKGSIWDKAIKGLRLRKGNILIGDSQTLGIAFKDPRFNGWSIGEIFALDQKLLPNARRDNFEKNDAYFALIEKLRSTASSITKDIRAASLKRNKELANAVKATEAASKITEDAISDGVTSAKKGALSHSLSVAKAAVEESSPDEAATYYQEIAFEELDMLIGKLQGATAYKALNTLHGLSNAEKKTLERVFNVLSEAGIADADKIIDTILMGFK